MPPALAWKKATRNYVMISDHGAAGPWRVGGMLGLIPGCMSPQWNRDAAHVCQCGEELQLAEAGGSGTVVGLSRRSGNPVVSVSHTGGDSFTGFVLVSAVVTSSTQTSLVSLRAHGSLVLIMAAPWSASRFNLTLSASSDANGAADTWAPVLDLGAGNFSGYSSLQMVDNETLLCLWEAGTSTINPGENTAIALSRIRVSGS